MIAQFYALYQEQHETVSQFVIRFQNLQLQISRPIPDNELKDVFLEAIREPLRTTLKVFDFRNQNIEQVIDKAIAMGRQPINVRSMDMSALNRTLPTMEELQFRQAVQCTTCLNTGHSTIECSLRTHCTICHSKLHSVEQCEYNLLNKTTTPVLQIFLENGYQNNRHIFNNGYQETARQNNYQQNQDFSAAQDNDYQQHNGGRFKQNRYKNKKFYKQKASRQFQQPPDSNEDGNHQFAQGEGSGTFVPTCYICRQEGHYANQCPSKGKGKTPAVHMVMPEIQQVTTRSKSKQSEWEIQEVVRKAAKEWVEEANKNNVSRMLQDNEINQANELPGVMAIQEQEETWKILADCQVSLPLTGLLKLVPRFTEKVATLIAQKGTEQVDVHYNQPSNNPSIMDEQNPSIKVIIHGQEIEGAIVDGGSGVNVINRTTCDRLGITKWEACPFWLRMADTSTVRPIRLLR